MQAATLASTHSVTLTNNQVSGAKLPKTRVKKEPAKQPCNVAGCVALCSTLADHKSKAKTCFVANIKDIRERNLDPKCPYPGDDSCPKPLKGSKGKAHITKEGWRFLCDHTQDAGVRMCFHHRCRQMESSECIHWQQTIGREPGL